MKRFSRKKKIDYDKLAILFITKILTKVAYLKDKSARYAGRYIFHNNAFYYIENSLYYSSRNPEFWRKLVLKMDGWIIFILINDENKLLYVFLFTLVFVFY